MEIILIRHTKPNIAKGICYGQSDIDLNNSFKEEIQLIKEQLNLGDINFFYSSPLKRCKILAEKLSANILFDERLKELNFGDWELKSWNEINAEKLAFWMNDFVNVTVPNGESYLDLHKRSINFLRDIKKLNADKIAIVTHAGVIKCINAIINNIDLKDSFNLNIKYGETLTLTI